FCCCSRPALVSLFPAPPSSDLPPGFAEGSVVVGQLAAAVPCEFPSTYKEALPMRINRISKPSRMTSVLAALSATALVLVGCSSESGDGDNGGGDDGAAESYSIGINQLVQHPALD